MPRPPFRVAMFLSSYAPLFVLLAYVNRCSAWTWRVLVAIAAASVLGLALVMLEKAREQGPELKVAHSKPQDGEVLAYIATYLIPFLGLDLTSSNDIVLFCGFMTVLMLVYINSNMLLVNPLLSIAGYHAFEVTDPDDHVYSLIARRRDLEIGLRIRPAQINRYLRLEVRRERP
ncbi:MAG: hypothetical protein ACJ768_20580 [Gaiellaceae bacterium]